jgi:hypothetical protein
MIKNTSRNEMNEKRKELKLLKKQLKRTDANIKGLESLINICNTCLELFTGLMILEERLLEDLKRNKNLNNNNIQKIKNKIKKKANKYIKIYIKKVDKYIYKNSNVKSRKKGIFDRMNKCMESNDLEGLDSLNKELEELVKDEKSLNIIKTLTLLIRETNKKYQG